MNSTDDQLACDYVLDRLDPVFRAAFEARLLQEEALRQQVREYETGLAARMGELPPRSPSPHVWSGIAHEIGLAPRRAGLRWAPVFKWGIAAVIAISLAAIAAERWIDRPYLVVVTLDSGSAEPGRLSIARVARGTNDAFVQLAELAESRWQDARSPRSFVVYDPMSNQGFIAVRDLPAAAASSHYQVWIANRHSGAIRPAGELNGTGLYSFAIDPAPGESGDELRVMVTREAGRAPARSPGRDVVLGG